MSYVTENRQYWVVTCCYADIPVMGNQVFDSWADAERWSFGLSTAKDIQFHRITRVVPRKLKQVEVDGITWTEDVDGYWIPDSTPASGANSIRPDSLLSLAYKHIWELENQ